MHLGCSSYHLTSLDAACQLTLSGVITSEREENCFDSRSMSDIAIFQQLRLDETLSPQCLAVNTLLEWCHGKGSCRWGNCEGLRVAGLDTHAKAVVRVGLPGAAPGSALLSRELVTVLPPPVGGLSRTLSGNQVGGREPGGCFGGFVRVIGGLANSALIAVSDFVRYGTTRCQGLGHLQLARKRRHRQTGRLRD